MDAVDARRLLDHLATGIIVVNHDLRVVTMNPAAEALWAVSTRQAQGLPFSALAGGADTIADGLRRCLRTGHPYTERELVLSLSGQTITVDCTVTPMLEYQPLQLIIEMRQVDRQLRISREENIIAQHNSTRLLVRNLAHEIKNPLGGLRGAAQLLEGEIQDTSLHDYTGIIIREADRLRNLVDRILGPNRPPVYGEVNIHEILERVCQLVNAESGYALSIHQDYDPSIPPLWGDADQLIQAILNIVRNAVQVLSDGGQITLRTRIGRHYIIAQKHHRLVARLEIIDNGPGIPEALRQAIFFPMISGRDEGTGLGLSIAQILINQHGGLIECDSRPGETVFTLLLPVENGDG